MLLSLKVFVPVIAVPSKLAFPTDAITIVNMVH